MAMAFQLIVALGNPEKQYAQTRHNLAWLVLEQLSFYRDLTWQRKFKGEFAAYPLAGQRVFFLKPQTYMNRSGESLQPLLQFYKLPIAEVLTLHDDIELEFGVVDLKKGGGLAGHNGLRSIATALGTTDFMRFRLGISRPQHGNVSAHVLGKFSDSEQAVLPTYLQQAARLLEKILTADEESSFLAVKKINLLG